LDAKPENPTRTVWALAWPAVALNSLQVINNLLDGFFVGHLDRQSVIAYGAMVSMLFMMFSLSMALGTAATAIVSRAYGANENLNVRTGAAQSLATGIVLSGFFAVLAFLSVPYAAQLLIPAGNPRATELMIQFIHTYSLGLPAIYVIQALAGSMRGVGDTKSPMAISGIQILIHIVLNFFLIDPGHRLFGVWIPGAGMGLQGAATALTGSAWLSAIGYLLYSRRTSLGAQHPFRLPKRDWFQRIMRIAIPAAVMAILRVLSLTAFQVILKSAHDGAAATAAIRVGFAIESIMFMPAFGLSMAAAALVGQSLGMKKPERAEKLCYVAAHHAALVTAVLCVPIFIFAPQIATMLLGDKADVAFQAVILIRYLCVTEIGFAYAMVFIGAMQGAGDTKRPLIITVICLWVLRIPLAAFFALSPGTLPLALGMGAAGAWLSMSITQGLQGILAWVLFRQGAWKTAKV
jgi:putative MATE family efflux protein